MLTKQQVETQLIRIFASLEDPDFAEAQTQIPASYLHAMYKNILDSEVQITSAFDCFNQALNIIQAQEVPLFRRSSYFFAMASANSNGYLKKNRRPLSYMLSRMDCVDDISSVSGRLGQANLAIGTASEQNRKTYMTEHERNHFRNLVTRGVAEIAKHPFSVLFKKYDRYGKREVANLFKHVAEILFSVQHLEENKDMAFWFSQFSTYLEFIQAVHNHPLYVRNKSTQQ
jgi:hypothetical protein